MKSLSAEQYERTQKIEKYDPTDVKNLLAHMSDLSGEGMLTSMNTKNFSKNPVWAAFQRVLGTADDAQLHIE